MGRPTRWEVEGIHPSACLLPVPHRQIPGVEKVQIASEHYCFGRSVRKKTLEIEVLFSWGVLLRRY